MEVSGQLTPGTFLNMWTGWKIKFQKFFSMLQVKEVQGNRKSVGKNLIRTYQ
jgi:hypothetical protein